MTPRTAAPSRTKLDGEVVVEAALALADGEGLDSVTIRRLAQALSVTPMALYWHFKDKDALLAAVADRMWLDTATELERSLTESRQSGDDDPWAQLRLTLEALVAVMRRHPAIAPLAPTRVVECEAGLSVTEQTLAFLDRRGFDPSRAAEVARFVLCSAVMLVDSQPGAYIVEAVEREEMLRRKRIALASLPPGRYPHVTAAAEYLTDCGEEGSYFERGVDLVVAGVRDQAPAAPPRRRPARRSGRDS